MSSRVLIGSCRSAVAVRKRIVIVVFVTSRQSLMQCICECVCVCMSVCCLFGSVTRANERAFLLLIMLRQDWLVFA